METASPSNIDAQYGLDTLSIPKQYRYGFLLAQQLHFIDNHLCSKRDKKKKNPRLTRPEKKLTFHVAALRRK
jgi:hypothetical protein